MTVKNARTVPTVTMINHKRYFNTKLSGATFGTRITSGSRKPKNFFAEETESRRWVFLLCALSVFIVLAIARLFELQLIKGSYFRLLAEGNRIRYIPIKAPRGEVLDRDGKALARNVPVYKLATFSDGGTVKETQLISREEALAIQSSGGEEANRLLVEVGREYPLSEASAHLVGYVNETSPGEVGQKPKCDSQNQKPPYQVSDLVGRMGIEEQYECLLRGINGEELMEVDARGRLVRRLGRREPVSGKTIQLSIDSRLQEAAYNALIDAPNEKGTAPLRKSGQKIKGAAVLEDPNNGQILALVSSPSFDPNALRENYADLAQDKDLPFFNRAIGGAYHPGSTFKIITSTAGLEEGKIDKNYEYEDAGFIQVGDFSYKNWYFLKYGRGEGVINLQRAIARSTDTFFYKVGEMVGPSRLADWAKSFGLGRKSGIDLPGETNGLIPTPEWKEKTKGERWYLGNTYHMSIGQGDVSATPLQIANMTSAVANGGKLCIPHLLSEKNLECNLLGIKSGSIDLVREGMLGACTPGGTAGVFFSFKPKVACKTGTAQTVGDKTHAWFTAYAPALSEEGAPQIVGTALIEGGGEGSIAAAPVVKKIFQEWFGRSM